MASSKTATICGLPSWVEIPRNDTATVGLSFVSIVIISFDRHFALSRPLVYIAEVSKSGEVILSCQKY